MIPQKHGNKWINEEISFLKDSIANNQTLEEIKKVISLRSKGAILTKANTTLGFGNYANKIDGLTYFKNNIKHKVRRCKNEICDEVENVSINSNKTLDTLVKVATDSVPQIQIDITDLEEIIALHKKIITPHLNIIEKLEKIKGTS